MSAVEELFREIDRRWPADGAKPCLRIIGSGALMLQAEYERATNDGDVFEAKDLAAATAATLRALAGRNTDIHARTRMYIDVVGQGLPFLPRVPQWHRLDALNAKLRRLELFALDIVDVLVSKLKPYRPRDQEDIRTMYLLDLLPHARFVERFRAAADEWAYEARAHELPELVRRLQRVERDVLGAAPTEIELPHWIDR